MGLPAWSPVVLEFKQNVVVKHCKTAAWRQEAFIIHGTPINGRTWNKPKQEACLRYPKYLAQTGC